MGTIHSGIFGVRIASILPFWKRNGETNKARWSIDPRGPSDFGHPRSFRASKQAFCVFPGFDGNSRDAIYGDPTVGSSPRLFHWTLKILRTFLGESRSDPRDVNP